MYYRESEYMRFRAIRAERVLVPEILQPGTDYLSAAAFAAFAIAGVFLATRAFYWCNWDGAHGWSWGFYACARSFYHLSRSECVPFAVKTFAPIIFLLLSWFRCNKFRSIKFFRIERIQYWRTIFLHRSPIILDQLLRAMNQPHLSYLAII